MCYFISAQCVNIINIFRNSQEKKDKDLSFLELLVQERNFKRRRAKHRGVHTNKKSHTEILREIINQQMEMYGDYISEQSDPAQAKDVQNIKTKDWSHEPMQDRTERLYKVFHSSSRNHDNFNFGERDSHYSKRDYSKEYYSKIDYLKRERSEERSYHHSRERNRRERYSGESDETHRKQGHRKSSRDRSRDRKFHKKDKHRSKSKHKDKHERKHKSRDRDRSSERYHSRHNNHKQKMRDKEY